MDKDDDAEENEEEEEHILDVQPLAVKEAAEVLAHLADVKEKEAEEASVPLHSYKVQAGKKRRDDDMDPLSGGCQIIGTPSVILSN